MLEVILNILFIILLIVLLVDAIIIYKRNKKECELIDKILRDNNKNTKIKNIDIYLEDEE